jgi:hypothetical protein
MRAGRTSTACSETTWHSRGSLSPSSPTPTRELFQQFREMCLPEKLSAKIKSANTMENTWVRLEAWFGDKALFIKDLQILIQIQIQIIYFLHYQRDTIRSIT